MQFAHVLTHGSRVELPVCFDVRNHFLVPIEKEKWSIESESTKSKYNRKNIRRNLHSRIAAVWNETLCVFELSKFVPHSTAISNDNRHRVVDNDVRRDMPVRDTFVRIHHGNPWTFFIALFKIVANLFCLIVWKFFLDCIKNALEAVVGVGSDFFQQGSMFVECALVVRLEAVSEQNRVTYFHHRTFEVQAEQNIRFLSILHFPVFRNQNSEVRWVL